MPNPFDMLWEDRPAVPVKPQAAKPASKPKPDHSIAKAIHAAYLAKLIDLKLHQDYAIAVAKATDGAGMTPVKPLATMGCNGGALLCDYCGKAIILESNPYYNVPADVAWERNPKREDRWLSYIKGGLMVVIVENGSLRIYHGYDGCPDHCYAKGKAEQAAAEAAYVRDQAKFKLIWDYFEETKPDNWMSLANDVFNVMCGFDPGIGVNKPC